MLALYVSLECTIAENGGEEYLSIYGKKFTMAHDSLRQKRCGSKFVVVQISKCQKKSPLTIEINRTLD